VRPAGVPVTIRRTDTEQQVSLRGGDDPVVVSGPPGEIILVLCGRAQTRDLTFDGPDDAVRRLRSAALGL
jgi:MDMPI C-terminal domain